MIKTLFLSTGAVALVAFAMNPLRIAEVRRILVQK